jgi:VWFA-related protein
MLNAEEEMTKILALASIVVSLHTQQQLPRPTFETGVDVVLVDVHVVDKQGKPILDLEPEEFEVQISGKRRRVTSVQLVNYSPAAGVPAAEPKPATAPRGVAAPRARRLYILAIDEHSLHIGNAIAAVEAAERFIDKLEPDDLVGLHAYPTGTARHDLTTDHASVRRALRNVTGLFDEPSSKFNLTPSEAIDIASGDRDAVLNVLRRQCGGSAPGCAQRDIVTEATSMVGFMEMKVSQSVGGLRALVRGLSDVPGRKLLVMVSGGLVATDRGSGRVNTTAETTQLGREAARANVAIFALHLDWSFIAAQASRGGLRTSYFRDSNMATTGLERVAGTAGGTVVRVFGTAPEAAFDRVLLETSAHYLLGVDGSAADTPGETHTIRVTVKRRGAQVRSRTQFVVPEKK